MTVTLSLGRHEEYGESGSWPISRHGAARAWCSATLIAEKAGRPQRIISSPIARALATAQIRAGAWGGLPLKTDDALCEDADQISLWAFLTELAEDAAAADLTHIHLVSHAPTIARLNNGYAAPLNPGDVLVWEAPDWQALAMGTRHSRLIRVYKCETDEKFAKLAQIIKQRQPRDVQAFLQMISENTKDRSKADIGSDAVFAQGLHNLGQI